jgi:uncharacterized protein (UPF0216 family)
LPDDLTENALFREMMAGELRLQDSDIQYRRKSLAGLMREELPLIDSNKGGPLLIKKRELEFLASLLNSEEQSRLCLPLIIEITPEEDEVRISGSRDVEGKILEKILKMPLRSVNGKLLFYRSQLVELRQHLKTALQYKIGLKEADRASELP